MSTNATEAAVAAKQLNKRMSGIFYATATNPISIGPKMTAGSLPAPVQSI